MTGISAAVKIRTMYRFLVLGYGVAAYLCFLGTFLYVIGFVMRVAVPRHIDSGESGPLATSLIINAILLSLFAVQHTIMARPAFKRWWTRFVPVAAERSTFVIAACACLWAMVWQWRPLPEAIWHVGTPGLREFLTALGWLGWALVLYSSFVIDHFDLFGLRQSVFYYLGKTYHHPPFAERSVYRLVRHPLMLGFLIAFWATPDMTVGRLAFALITTGYILVAINIEERDLVAVLGQAYIDYRRRTPALLPIPRGSRTLPQT